ncbi:MAG: NFACT family protein [Candidatus Diapherotrites archaeon]
MNEVKLTNLALNYLLAELRPLLEGAFLNRVQEVDREIYKIKMRTPEGSRDLILCPQALYLTQYKIPAKQNMHGFGAFLNKHLKNRKIARVTQHNFDRVAVLEIGEVGGVETTQEGRAGKAERGTQKGGYYLVIEFLADFNIILLDGEKIILQPLHRQQWKDRTIKKGEPYKFPPARGLNPAELKQAELQKIFAQSADDAVRTLVKNINIAPVFAEEALHLAKIDKHTAAKKLNPAELKRLNAGILALHLAPSGTRKNPALFKNTLLPFALQSFPDAKEIDSLNNYLDEMYSAEHLTKEGAEQTEEISKERRKTEYYLAQQTAARDTLQKKSDESARAAELIYTHFPALEELISALKDAEKKKIPAKEVMYKMQSAAKKGNTSAKLFVDYNPKNKELIVDLE